MFLVHLNHEQYTFKCKTIYLSGCLSYKVGIEMDSFMAIDEIITFAMPIQRDNESHNGWLSFLLLLKSTCLALINSHQLQLVNIFYYTMVSDRQKGLAAALASAFSSNHATYCALHIQRNVYQRYGSNAAVYVWAIAKTYTTVKEEKLFEAIRKPEVVEYLKATIK